MNQINVNIKKLHPNAIVPEYATLGSAGLDLTATSESITLGYIEYGTGLAFQIPEGYVGLLFPRSSISSNTTLSLANSVGIIDSDYTGEIKLRFRNLVFGSAKRYKVGERIGQLLIVPYPKVKLTVVEELNQTDRGNGGHGSTGK